MSYDYARMAAGAILPMIFDTGSAPASSPSSPPPFDTITLMHANTIQVVVTGTQGEQTLLDSSVSFSSIVAGSVFSIEAFGSTGDPGANSPDLTFTIKWKSTVIWTGTAASIGAQWSFRALVTVRSAGVTGKAEAAVFATQENGTLASFPTNLMQTTVDTTGTAGLDFRGSVVDFTGGEYIHCEQAVILRLS